jgi:FlaA1/EpsC-like NDP-sugar epimerase
MNILGIQRVQDGTSNLTLLTSKKIKNYFYEHLINKRCDKVKVLITGGSGFIGPHIVDLLLEKGLSVIIVDNVDTFRQNLISESYKTYNVDILSPNLEEIFYFGKARYYHPSSSTN